MNQQWMVTLDPFLAGLSCILVLVMIVAGMWGISWGRGRERYEKPKVTGARVVCGKLFFGDDPMMLGELEVESSHAEHIVRELHLPASSVVSIVEKNKRYKVQFDLPQKQTPESWMADVWEGKKKSKVRVTYTQRQANLDRVRDWARENGYDGPVEDLL